MEPAIRPRLYINITTEGILMSEYFQKFPLITYDFAIAGESPQRYLVTDILRRVKITSNDIKNGSAFDIYTIAEGDTPEIVSDKYYGTSYYHWLILMVNDILYGLDGFPKSQYDLEQYCAAKYTNVNGVHHYEDTEGNEVNTIVSGNSLKIFDPVTMTWNAVPISSFVPVTNYEYEEQLNENKRVIYLLKPLYVNPIISEIDRLMRMA